MDVDIDQKVLDVIKVFNALSRIYEFQRRRVSNISSPSSSTTSQANPAASTSADTNNAKSGKRQKRTR
jgi:hypothetical protein